MNINGITCLRGYYHSKMVTVGCVLSNWGIISVDKGMEMYRRHMRIIISDILPKLHCKVWVKIKKNKLIIKLERKKESEP